MGKSLIGFDLTNFTNPELVNKFLQENQNFSVAYLPPSSALSFTYTLADNNFIQNVISDNKLVRVINSEIAKVDSARSPMTLTMISPEGNSAYIDEYILERTVYVPYGGNAAQYENL